MEDTPSVPAFLCDVPPFSRIRKEPKETTHHLIYVTLASFVSTVYIVMTIDCWSSALVVLLGMFFCIFSLLRFSSKHRKMAYLLGDDEKTAFMLITYNINYEDVVSELRRMEGNGLDPSSIQCVDLVRRKLVKRAINNAIH